MLSKYIEQLRPEVLKLFKDEPTGHDITHLERTMNMAINLQRSEGGDEIIIGISAFLHDIHRIMGKELGRFVSPKESLETINEMLSILDLTEKQKSKILHCIEYHEEYNWNNPKNKENDINVLVLQDADNLDGIGAIGMMRTILYSSTHGIPMYDSNVPIEMRGNYVEGEHDESMVHHCYNKLFRLGDNMNTDTAKKIAKDRTKFMKDFVSEFLSEWNGEK